MRMCILGAAVFVVSALGGCQNSSNVPGVSDRHGGASPGLGSGTDSSGSPDWMDADGKGVPPEEVPSGTQEQQYRQQQPPQQHQPGQ